MDDVASIRRAFVEGSGTRFVKGRAEDGSGDTVELLHAHFLADEPSIFGDRDDDYVARELSWYLSQSRYVDDMEPPVPKIWRSVSAKDPIQRGLINSNYGWMIFSEENGSQFDRCVEALVADPETRQACMIYQRPSMHEDSTKWGMSDFVCTNAVHVHVRPRQSLVGPVPELSYFVSMRSNDAVFGYRNDVAWHDFVMSLLLETLRERLSALHPRGQYFQRIERGPMVWSAASLHLYRRHWHYLSPRTEESE